MSEGFLDALLFIIVLTNISKKKKNVMFSDFKSPGDPKFMEAFGKSL